MNINSGNLLAQWLILKIHNICKCSTCNLWSFPENLGWVWTQKWERSSVAFSAMSFGWEGVFGDALVKQQLCQPNRDQYFFFRGWNFEGIEKIIELWKLEVRRRILPKHNSILQRGKKKLTMSPLCQWKLYDLLRVEKEADLSLPMPEGWAIITHVVKQTYLWENQHLF